MMCRDEIEMINEWFDHPDEDRSSDTYRIEDDYVVHPWDMDNFCKFLNDTFPDIVGIKCMAGNGGIWFRDGDLKKAEFL